VTVTWGRRTTRPDEKKYDEYLAKLPDWQWSPFEGAWQAPGERQNGTDRDEFVGCWHLTDAQACSSTSGELLTQRRKWKSFGPTWEQTTTGYTGSRGAG